MSETIGSQLSRRDFLRLAGAQSAAAFVPTVYGATRKPLHLSAHGDEHANLYADLLHSWCDGLLTRQVCMGDAATRGGFLCPSCVLIHGRCGEATYPLLHIAHTSGDDRYLRAALLVHDWSERQVSQADGSWINDVTLSSWKGITVFHAIALAEALRHHASLLDSATRSRWTDRLAVAAKFLDSYITIETGNINYPVTSSLAFILCGQVLGEHRYLDRGRKMAHAVLDFFTPSGILFGEGHPQRGLTPKGCRPVDLGYDVEESLPSLGMYAVLAKDTVVRDQVVAAMRAALDFMLPDGSWDNSWGTRNYKWSWWGSRTTDGCHPGFIMLAQYEPRLKEAARRNLELMAACTHNGLLYGGPDYFVHGDFPCIHHTFTHAKALATVLDECPDPLPAAPLPLPRDEPYGLRSFPVFDTHLAAVGDWRATVTAYDCPYEGEVTAKPRGGHVSGGALAMLFHRSLGPVLSASMTRYEMIEISNQQACRDVPHMPLTPRIELNQAGHTYVSDTDYAATLTARHSEGRVDFEAHGRLLSVARLSLPGGDVRYTLRYRLDPGSVEITALVENSAPPGARFILPVIARAADRVQQPSVSAVRISKPAGQLVIRSSRSTFDPIPETRSFNLVPGFECVPLAVPLQPGQEVTLRIEAHNTA
ncbi:MAG TPA: hypothetical protein VHX13_03635 [Acidobacteriaceae bacterium]|jgi:hypothetical protein|nr:hypothetical protein [Acidobacteriaceae bacterium]